MISTQVVHVVALNEFWFGVDVALVALLLVPRRSGFRIELWTARNKVLEGDKGNKRAA